MDKLTKAQGSTTRNKENVIDDCVLNEKTVHHDFTVKAMGIGADFTVLEHNTIKKIKNNQA